jgi:eukaryotic-like serine/threonine-protein kinase
MLTRVSHYDLIEQIGAGGMGVVWKAEDTLLRRTVAIKSIARAGTVERFLQEARAASTLHHPNIITVHDILEQDGELYLVLEFVSGGTLQQALATGPMPLKQGLAIARQIAAGLAKAHEAGIVHRDLKPANILFDENGTAKIADFGLAKQKTSDDGATLTSPGQILGTVAYMSPEQAEGKAADVRSDVFALGVLLYEMFGGRHPFGGDSVLSTLHAIITDRPRPLPSLRSEIPVPLVRVIDRCLEKNPQNRFASAAEVSAALERVRDPRPASANPAWWIAAALVLGAIVAGWAWHRRQVQTDKTAALAEIHRLLAQPKYVAAYDRAWEFEKRYGKSAELNALWPEITRPIHLETDPPGAEVLFRDVEEPDQNWRRAGTTPADLKVPRGYYLWKFTKPGFEDSRELAPAGLERQRYALFPKQPVPPEMVLVPQAPSVISFPIANLGNISLVDLPPFFIDRTEVTNRDYLEFIRQGGYEKPEFWKPPFRKNGRTLVWSEAVAAFRDITGRPGPSTWEAGRYPAGQDSYPVSGVSWYEAAAYCEFRQKSLPTIYHWYRASDPRSASWVVPASNFGGKGPAAVGQYQGIGPFGTFDMAGNVAEWTWTEASGESRFILGGDWGGLLYKFTQSNALPAFDRSKENGIRCARYPQPPADQWLAPRARTQRAAGQLDPVNDQTYRGYLALYEYERGDLNAKIESVDDTNPEWRREKVSFTSTASRDRVLVQIFLPKTGKPPFQTLVYHASSAVNSNTPSEQFVDGFSKWEFLMRSGRAVCYVVLPNTQERFRNLSTDLERRNAAVQRVQDFRRALDYLESRPDIDSARLAYLGKSWGAGSAPLILAQEPRLKAAILHDGGVYAAALRPEVDSLNFAPRTVVPVLMINGRYDYFFPVETSQNVMFRLLGTPADRKRHVLVEASHDVAVQQPIVIRETLDWLDRYLGPVAH